MDSLGGKILTPDSRINPYLYGTLSVLLVGICYSILASKQAPKEQTEKEPGLARAFFLFCYSCFFKPHSGDSKGSQQDALESFYKTQAGAYDTTRKVLLKGREDMLCLASAQLAHRAKNVSESATNQRRVWVDIGGGTGWNIEAMAEFVDVPTFFDSVYLVDFSPSLCEVARKRFVRLGWNNVTVICEDARKFHLEDHENDVGAGPHGASLITMSYSLSMIPDYYSVIDSLPSLLAPNGIIAVVDFYVQSQNDVKFRNYTGGSINRHVNMLSRTFWRAWFDLDRVVLESGRRDYLEYQFGTVLNANNRNAVLGAIPYYVWLGSHRRSGSPAVAIESLEKLDAQITESPYKISRSDSVTSTTEMLAAAVRSKAYDAATVNLSANLPLPSFYYQNHHWRIHYDDQLQKHTQFNDEYIYAFTWEDSRVDQSMLQLTSDDVVLAITSAGDNILSYALQGPAKIHAVDLNPTQNHLLELKAAAYSSLSYEDFWMMFGEGKHPNFRSLLMTKMSPHLSSRAFQYWLSRHSIFDGSGNGLYDTGGSKHAIRVFRWISYLFGCRAAVKSILGSVKTLQEQRDIWRDQIRPALLSTLVSKFIVSQKKFLWTALGVPKNQLAIIEADHAVSDAVVGPNASAQNTRSYAIWEYMVNTLDPMINDTLIATDNPYYLVCLAGRFNKSCYLEYQSPEAHAKLSQPGALDNLHIHTDEIQEVLARLSPGSLTVAVVMDSMDWFDPCSDAAAAQIRKLNQALKMGGRVMLRSAGLRPWYINEFELHGFKSQCMGSRAETGCIDRVNMYASCWILTKVGDF